MPTQINKFPTRAHHRRSGWAATKHTRPPPRWKSVFHPWSFPLLLGMVVCRHEPRAQTTSNDVIWALLSACVSGGGGALAEDLG